MVIEKYKPAKNPRTWGIKKVNIPKPELFLPVFFEILHHLRPAKMMYNNPCSSDRIYATIRSDRP